VRWLAAITALAGAAAVVVGTISSRTAAAPKACSEERWAVKTVQDPAGKAIDLSKIEKTTVGALRSEPVHRGPGGSRGDGVESTFFQVRARLVSAKIRTAATGHPADSPVGSGVHPRP
jgi:hypothetical protein